MAGVRAVAGGVRVVSSVSDARVGRSTVVTVTVDSGVGSICSTGVVGAMGTFGELALLVAVESLLNLVDESRHVGYSLVVDDGLYSGSVLSVSVRED